MGITTMRALLDELARSGTATTLLYRISRPRDAVFRRELDSFTQRYPVRVVYLDGSRPRRESWLPAQYAGTSDVAALRRLVPDLLEHEVFLCGPPPWIAPYAPR